MNQSFMDFKLNDKTLYEFGGSGALMNFAHGNGYPPAAYKAFCSYLTSEYKVVSGKMRPLWEPHQDPNELKSWDLLADDMIHFMKSNQMKNVVGLAHSLGGTVSILAAHQHPELFSQLILMDPVVLSKASFNKSESLSIAQRKSLNPFAKACSTRRDHWSNKAEVISSWRSKKVFQKFSKDSLNQLVEGSITTKDSGVKLLYSKEWETQLYVTEVYVLDKAFELKMPVTVIRAGIGSIISEEVWNQWNREADQTTFLEFSNGSHLFPMEYPEETATIIKEILN